MGMGKRKRDRQPAMWVTTTELICEGRGVPLAVRLTGANRNDSQEALALVDAIAALGLPKPGPGVDRLWGPAEDLLRLRSELR